MSLGTSTEKGERLPLRLGPLIMGGAGFSYQLVNEPNKAPAVDILEKAFEAGVRTIDTSPYYDPSELVLGAALSHPRITSKYRREDYTLMTKVGRITANNFDYSAQWIRNSVARSMDRFQTSYLDVVFCHDVEFVSPSEAVEAVGTLFQLAKEGAIRYAGISGYDLNALSTAASLVQEKYRQPVDVVQTWGQLSLQNTRLETFGLSAFQSAGVKTICSSSPLVVGLLSSQGVPVGGLGDWHPAPEGLRIQAKKAAERMDAMGDSISALALRYAIRKAVALSSTELQISTITGFVSLDEIIENVATARQVLGDLFQANFRKGGNVDSKADATLEQRDNEHCIIVREILDPWVDYDFSASSRKTD